jgi:predicted kinase
MLAGPPGSGKSYLARLLVERLGAELVQTDTIRKTIFRQPRYNAREHAAVYAESHRRIERQLRLGRTVVFDATNLEEHKRQIVYRLAEKASVHVVIVLTYAPLDAIEWRLSGRKRGADPLDRSDADWQVHLKLSRVDPIRLPHLLVNTTIGLEQIVELVATRVQRGPWSLSLRLLS